MLYRSRGVLTSDANRVRPLLDLDHFRSLPPELIRPPPTTLFPLPLQRLQQPISSNLNLSDPFDAAAQSGIDFLELGSTQQSHCSQPQVGMVNVRGIANRLAKAADGVLGNVQQVVARWPRIVEAIAVK